MLKTNGQVTLDKERKYYDIIFPADMAQEQIEDFIRSIGSNLRGGSAWRGVPSVVFETYASASTGISHRMRVPKDSAVYITTQLQGALPGIDINEINEADEVGFQAGVTLHMANSAEELPIKSVKGLSSRILRSLQNAVMEHDAVMIQWNIVHSNNQKQPPSDQPVQTARPGVMKAVLFGTKTAGHDEVYSRRQKQVDQNYVAIGRVVARGQTPARAHSLVEMVVRAFISEGGGNAYFYAKKSDPRGVSADVKAGRTPLTLTAQFSVPELAGVIGWPIGNEYVPGLRRESIPAHART